jgi:parallel beta-helix repeat protein
MSKLKLHIIVLALWLAFSGVAAAEQLYVNESGWWRDGGAFNVSETPIQTAVGAADAGDAIFVWNGSYTENVDVDKPRLTLEGEGADVVTVTAADPDDHVFEVTQDYVNISGFTVIGATGRFIAGFYLYNADHCVISENNACENDRGIYLRASSNNMLMNNAANSNNERGIYLSSSSSNTIANNTANLNKDFGIYLLYSSSNTIANNIANQWWYGGIYLQYSSYNTIVDNDCSNNVYGVGIRLRDLSNYNTLTCNNASNNGHGIYIECNSNTLTSNTVNSNGITGIYIGHSSNNMLTGNTANLNDRGINVWESSDNTLTSNTANLNSYYGICLHDSSNGNLINNTANSNGNYGIHLRSSSNCMLEGNTANSNDICGIYLQYLSNSHITCNWVQDNTVRGFYLYRSTGNNISCNNIIENGNYNTVSGGWEWQFYNEQSNPVEAKHNYWGPGMDSNTIDASIYDDEECGWGEVEFYPFETEPVPCAPTPEEPHTFTTTDAVIALQIAAGSRQPDLQWDVSGDGSVTSLDALMILQATACKSPYMGYVLKFGA